MAYLDGAHKQYAIADAYALSVSRVAQLILLKEAKRKT